MSIIQNIENFNAQTMAIVLPCARIWMILSAGATIFEGRINVFSIKLNIIKLSLSLFLAKYSVGNLFLVLADMQFPIQDHYIHMSRYRKGST